MKKSLVQGWQSSPWKMLLLVVAISSIIFAITLQTNINGSTHPYVTDVGELQNALPRW